MSDNFPASLSRLQPMFLRSLMPRYVAGGIAHSIQWHARWPCRSPASTEWDQGSLGQSELCMPGLPNFTTEHCATLSPHSMPATSSVACPRTSAQLQLPHQALPLTVAGPRRAGLARGHNSPRKYTSACQLGACRAEGCQVWSEPTACRWPAHFCGRPCQGWAVHDSKRGAGLLVLAYTEYQHICSERLARPQLIAAGASFPQAQRASAPPQLHGLRCS